MATRYLTTKYGTKINIEGLTPEQIARVRNTAEANGAYGAKGAALANTLRKRAGTPKTGGTDTLATGTGTTTGTTTGTESGTLDSTVDDFLEGIFGNIKPLDTSGAPQILTAEDLASQRQSTQDALYRQNTKDLETRRSRDLEAQKQELANRGIPLNFASDPSNPNNLYARSLADVNNRYDTLDQQAKDAAITGADQRMAAEAGVNKTAYDAFMTNATNNFQSQLDAAAAGTNALQVLTARYGISRDEAQKILDRKMQEKIAKLQSETTKYVANKAHSGGGGGGGNDGSPLFPGNAPGF